MSKAICGIDSACWDALAKAENVSCCTLFGRLITKTDVKLFPYPIYASSLSRNLDGNVLAEKLRDLEVKHGVTAFKIKVGKRMGSSDTNDTLLGLETFITCRNVLQKNSLIAVDGNGCCHNAEAAYKMCEKLSELNPWFIEEPIVWFKYLEYFKLQKRLMLNKNVKVAAGEQEYRTDVWEMVFDDNVTSGRYPFHIIQPDVGYCGGPSNMFKIAQIARNKTLEFLPHSPQGDMLSIMTWHVLCALAKNKENIKSRLEVACVDDGLTQVTLDNNGSYSSPYFSPDILIYEGKIKLNEDVSDGNTGWGVNLNPKWLKLCDTKQVLPETGKNDVKNRRSFF